MKETVVMLNTKYGISTGERQSIFDGRAQQARRWLSELALGESERLCPGHGWDAGDIAPLTTEQHLHQKRVEVNVVLAGHGRLVDGADFQLVLDDHGVQTGSNRDDIAVGGEAVQVKEIMAKRQIEIQVRGVHAPVELDEWVKPSEAAPVKVHVAVEKLRGGSPASSREIETSR
jgi:hypothetical protein